jgi:hypothetical protein
MDKVDAGNLLRINRGASETEVEVAYRKRRDEVRKRFVSARDRNTRNRCEREFSALEQARNCLLAQMDDLVNEREEPPVERQAAPVEGEERPIEEEAPSVDREAPLVERQVPQVECDVAATGHESLSLKRPEQPIDREEVPAERQEPRIECQVAPVEHEALPVEHDALPVEREAAPSELKAPPVERETLPVEREEPSVERKSYSLEREELPKAGETPPVERESQPVERLLPARNGVSPAITRVPAPIKRVSGTTDRVSAPIDRISAPIKRAPALIPSASSPIEPVTWRIDPGSSTMDHGSLPKEEGSTSLQAAATQVVIWSSRRQWLAIIGVMFILAAAFALGFFWPHAADKPRPGRLAVNTVPDNAEVWLDGISQGKTPMVLEFFAPGDRQLKVELPEDKAVQLVSVEQGSVQPTPTPSLPGHSNVNLVSPSASPNVLPSGKPPAYPDERYPQTRLRLLTETEIGDLNYAELRYAINEIYARHGAPFLSEPEIEKQFRGFEWYHPDRDLKLSQIEASFSAIEKKNVDILARLRDQKRPR